MKELIFATGNEHKLAEVSKMFNLPMYEIKSMNTLGFDEDIAETGSTLEENALLKARTIHDKYGVNVFAEDTGLEVTALDGAPGVNTARYAGEDKIAENNMQLLIQNLTDKSDRSARFRTVISLIMDDQEYSFEGYVNGLIAPQKSGEGGFGYDPIFIPSGYTKTFAELDPSIKNSISHRYRAMTKLLEFLKTISKSQ